VIGDRRDSRVAHHVEEAPLRRPVERPRAGPQHEVGALDDERGGQLVEVGAVLLRGGDLMAVVAQRRPDVILGRVLGVEVPDVGDQQRRSHAGERYVAGS
jgi:hypothetical protein